MDEGLVYLSLFLSWMEEGSYVGGSLVFVVVVFLCVLFLVRAAVSVDLSLIHI